MGIVKQNTPTLYIDSVLYVYIIEGGKQHQPKLYGNHAGNNVCRASYHGSLVPKEKV